MVLTPLKRTWIQSGNSPEVASFHPPPVPQPAPERLLSMTALGGKPALFVVEAIATPPFTASATLMPDEGVLARKPLSCADNALVPPAPVAVTP